MTDRRVVLITGATDGIGRATARALAAGGMKVIVHGRSKAKVDATVSALAAELPGAELEGVAFDLGLVANVRRGAEHILAKVPALHVLINNAGLFALGLSETFSSRQVSDMFDVNVIGIQRVTRAALPDMRKNRAGLIINIGSILGRVTIPFMGLYGATKFAVDALTESYRFELSQLGVDVVLVQPSAYPTNLYSALQQAADPSRAEGYGPVAAVPGELVKFLTGVFTGKDAPDSHDVAKALVDLVATPAGQRPQRLIVGAPYGADAANAALAPIQSELVKALGMDGLRTLKVG